MNIHDVGCCYCTSKTRNSESNSQRKGLRVLSLRVVIALVKLEILKAIHNPSVETSIDG